MTENKQETQEQESTNRESMVWYRSFVDSVEKLNDINIKYLCYYSIFNYGLNGELPTTDSEIVNALFAFAKPLIDKNINRYEACKRNGAKGAEYGKLGGAPKGNQNAKKKEKQPQKQPQNILKQPLNVNENVNDNENVNVNDNENENDNVLLKSEKFSLISKKFTASFPNKDNNITKEQELAQIDFEQIDIDLLIKKVKDSEFLLDCNNLGLQWCLLNYQRIIKGNYDKSMLKTAKNESQGHIPQADTTIKDLNRLENALNKIENVIDI